MDLRRPVWRGYDVKCVLFLTLRQGLPEKSNEGLASSWLTIFVWQWTWHAGVKTMSTRDDFAYKKIPRFLKIVHRCDSDSTEKLVQPVTKVNSNLLCYISINAWNGGFLCQGVKYNDGSFVIQTISEQPK